MSLSITETDRKNVETLLTGDGKNGSRINPPLNRTTALCVALTLLDFPAANKPPNYQCAIILDAVMAITPPVER